MPHVHGVVTCGGFLPDGGFEPAAIIDLKTVRELFESTVFSVLRAKGLIGREFVEQIKSCKHTGFDVRVGPAITDAKEIVRVGMYTVRAPAASGRLIVDDGPRVKY